MKDYENFFKKSLNNLKLEGNYRVFADLEKLAGSFPQALNYKDNSVSEVTVWCSNDYLGMSQNQSVLANMVDALTKVGAGSGGTRNISGTNHYHVLLERELCYLHQKESALLFNSGYLANQASLSTLGKKLPDCIFFSDEKNHASMIQGMKNSNAKKVIFKHNDLQDLENNLIKHSKAKSKVIVFESVYSMDGDFAPISKICDLAKKYNALTFLDEVHAVGIYGQRGAGVAEKDGVMEKIDIIQGTLAKAFGVIGGYITGKKETIDFIRSFSSGFIFTTSLPPCIAAGAYTSIRHLKFSSSERERLFKVVNELKAQLKKNNIPFIQSDSHIIPVIIGDPVLCKKASQILLDDFQIYVQPINFPTVPRGKERLRITASPQHSFKMIKKLVSALSTVFESLEINKAA
ncbi:MAG: 5-aminolevulinic acid synthase [Pelagibacteraceae bacterium TMED65]|nr:5-aminolevulinate synthase [Rickettsiales bacterium]OUU52255.1 MAG: 5-aminolevulinic acid synthase [Pelagibacteraceae bacterium TMED65]|tara:strand:+ start:2783 stop:3997 length:1215 start_codon:yes stop_codon:yes gene_type:complete